MRYAIYYTPDRTDPLTRVAARWLGRDAFTGEALAPQAVGPLSAAEIAYHTAPPRRYGFHATLKAPFRLAEGTGEAELLAALDEFAAGREPFAVPLVVGRLAGFHALVPREPAPALADLAAAVVCGFERFRAPLTPAEIARRNPDGLSGEELKNLHKWGYPHVFEAFRFHMTLTGRVDAAESRRVRSALESRFGPVLAAPQPIASIALFVEPEPGAPFRVRAFRRLGRESERKTA
ncbi:DUF1045 domain-containing protein [Aquibium sp. A9E412]|uniref:DUF1045 domain-containing protein n=1 Tax=Aquibium sp. A9E412 TaxID=2976767 RepID=UPI0025B12BF6|nr:DUF1045 domain-containing protein [Aquibium sp. A9E412]MDN2565907.1 DUF1045 domain-containing protein [Aquibium sp. A9E412]